MSKDLIDLLDNELKLLDDSVKMLEYSFNNCKKFGIQESYGYEELEKFESLTSRFSRTSDILIQRVFRLIDKIELEDEGFVRDRINRAEKRNLINSAKSFVEIRKLRNDISHEYIPSVIEDIFEDVFSLTPEIFDSVVRVKLYCKKYFA